jgi:hypothetical protein
MVKSRQNMAKSRRKGVRPLSLFFIRVHSPACLQAVLFVFEPLVRFVVESSLLFVRVRGKFFHLPLN